MNQPCMHEQLFISHSHPLTPLTPTSGDSSHFNLTPSYFIEHHQDHWDKSYLVLILPGSLHYFYWNFLSPHSFPQQWASIMLESWHSDVNSYEIGIERICLPSLPLIWILFHSTTDRYILPDKLPYKRLALAIEAHFRMSLLATIFIDWES